MLDGEQPTVAGQRDADDILKHLYANKVLFVCIHAPHDHSDSGHPKRFRLLSRGSIATQKIYEAWD
jgi:hypothetical protein